MSVLNALLSSQAGAYSPAAFLQPSGLGLNNTFSSPFNLGGSTNNNDSQLMMVLLLRSLLSDLGGNDTPTENIGLPLEDAPVEANTAANKALAPVPAAATNAAQNTIATNSPVEITEPRSGDIALAGYPWLARSIDKARLKSQGKLDDLKLLFPCPQDKQLHQKLGIDSEEFRQIVAGSNSDEEVIAALKARGANIQ